MTVKNALKREGRQEGLQEGRREMKKAATRMLHKGITAKDVLEITHDSKLLAVGKWPTTNL